MKVQINQNEVIWKTTLDEFPALEGEFELPEGALAITTGLAQGQLSVWWIIPDTKAAMRKYRVIAVPTGVPYSGPAARLLGVVVMQGWLVLHVFVVENATG